MHFSERNAAAFLIFASLNLAPGNVPFLFPLAPTGPGGFWNEFMRHSYRATQWKYVEIFLI